ncbi:MAG: hypothetical protein F6K24_46080, partial [Okeania sp. SIO2D1]|nr:hypothetical protein [Okeania sp. SIO2D1]
MNLPTRTKILHRLTSPSALIPYLRQLGRRQENRGRRKENLTCLPSSSKKFIRTYYLSLITYYFLLSATASTSAQTLPPPELEPPSTRPQLPEPPQKLPPPEELFPLEPLPS